jgi:cystathionine beta-lyase
VSRTIVEATQLFKVTVSFGNVISLISLPCFMSHASIPAEVRAARGLPDDLVRISAGIEDAGDLIADLKRAMDKAWDEQARQRAAAGSSSNGGGGGGGSNGGGGAAPGVGGGDRVAQLEARIAQLEAQLGGAAAGRGQQQQLNGHVSSASPSSSSQPAR